MLLTYAELTLTCISQLQTMLIHVRCYGLRSHKQQKLLGNEAYGCATCILYAHGVEPYREVMLPGADPHDTNDGD